MVDLLAYDELALIKTFRISEQQFQLRNNHLLAEAVDAGMVFSVQSVEQARSASLLPCQTNKALPILNSRKTRIAG